MSKPNEISLSWDLSRRTFLAQTGLNLGAIALASMDARASRPAQPSLAPRAKRIIFLT